MKKMKKPRNRPKKVKDWAWRWVCYEDGERLHRVCELDIEKIEAEQDGTRGKGKTLCGRKGNLSMPGVMGRMGLPRCHHCCRMAEVPDGLGNPFNSAKTEKEREIAER